MSVYIKGMEMPKDDVKNIMILADGRVFQFSGYGNPKPLGTAVPVPEHGRLGDLDDVINDIHHYLCEGCSDYLGPDAKTESCDYCGGMMLIKTIERKTSIIPADKEEQT